MPLTQKQEHNIKLFYSYLQALRNISSQNLSISSKENISDDEKKIMWESDFVLQAMIDNQIKYIKLLDCFRTILHQSQFLKDQRLSAVLGALFDKIKSDPLTHLRDYIEEVEKSIQSVELKSSLNALSSEYDKEYNDYCLVSGFGFLVSLLLLPTLLGTALIALAPLSPLSPLASGLVFICLSGCLMALATVCFMLITRVKVNIHTSSKDNINNVIREIDLLPNDTTNKYSTVRNYDYGKKEIDNEGRVIVKIDQVSHPVRRIDELKILFFKSEQNSSLFDKVQIEFNKAYQ